MEDHKTIFVSLFSGKFKSTIQVKRDGMNLIELNVDTVLKSTRKSLVTTASEKTGKGYHLNVRTHLNQFKITAIDLEK